MDFTLTDTQQHIQSQARAFAQDRVAPLAREMDEKGEMPPALIQEMAELGFLGGPLPKEYGGGGWDAVSLAVCYEELGRADSSVRGTSRSSPDLESPWEMKLTTSRRVTSCKPSRYTACDCFSLKMATSTLTGVTSLRPLDCATPCWRRIADP